NGAIRIVVVLHHQRGHWPSNDVAPTDDHAVFPWRPHAGFLEHYLNSRRRARNEPVACAREHLADILRVKTVDVLRRIDSPDHGLGINMFGKGHLHEYAVDPRVGVERVDTTQ